GHLNKAARSYAQALTQRPDFPEAVLRVAWLQLEVGRIEEADATSLHGLRLAPGLADAHRVRGNILGHRQRYAEAVAAMQQALALDPGFAAAYSDLATLHINFGHRDEAIAALEQALALAPWMTQVQRALLDLRGQSPADMVATLAPRHANPQLPAHDRVHLGFALGAAHEQLGNYSAALGYFADANAINRTTVDYDRSEDATAFDELKRAFPAELLARRRAESAAGAGMIFIVGMPRSGTTLTEQILASHPDVHGGGETMLVSEMVNARWRRPGQLAYAELLSDLGDRGLEELGREIERRGFVDAGGRRCVTEKLPDNFRLLGLIAAVLPQARIVHCHRDPADTCLSIFKQHFAGAGLQYAYDLTEIAAYYRLYEDLMRHWDEVLPIRPTVVELEAMVADQRGETERLLAYLGLPWADSCLDFFKTERSVRTVSALQVREPINAHGIGIAARYGAGLESLHRALRGDG
ncbi:MAG TPA: sulfotransferase, partial [Devosia sp.]|nr:sulfotransferase [Devosia sp.]